MNEYIAITDDYAVKILAPSLIVAKIIALQELGSNNEILVRLITN